MPRSGGGIYSLPAGSTVANGDVSDATDVNGPFSDIEADMNVARPVVAGGTGASTAADARTNLGLVIGTNVQAYDAGLQSIAGLTTAADKMIYTTASDTYAVTDLTAAGRALLDDANAAAQRTTLGLGALATAASVTTAEIAAATLVTAAETIGANNNDTTIPTSAAVKAYADAAAAARGMTLLATLTTTSGTVQTASSLDLTTYTALYIAINGVSFTGAASLTMNGVTITQGTAGAADALYGHHWLSLATGVSMGGGEVVAASPGIATVVQRVARSGYSNATTSISFGGGTFDAGQILIYGVR